jgi:hypothetical protein
LSERRPLGVTVVALLFFSASAYLVILGLVRLANPYAIPLSLGAPLLHGLELSGPYMFLLVGTVGAVVGFGLLRLNNLARRAAAMIAIAGIVMLVPKVSADTGDFSPRFFLAGSMIMVRAMIAWYLWQSWTAAKFR